VVAVRQEAVVDVLVLGRVWQSISLEDVGYKNESLEQKHSILSSVFSNSSYKQLVHTHIHTHIHAHLNTHTCTYTHT